MNDQMLLKLMLDLLKSDKPSVEEVRCARTIVNSMITNASQFIPNQTAGLLDPEAQQARSELQ